MNDEQLKALREALENIMNSIAERDEKLAAQLDEIRNALQEMSDTDSVVNVVNDIKALHDDVVKNDNPDDVEAVTDNTALINAMATAAANPNSAVAEAHLDALLNNHAPEDFAEKLKSLSVQPNPIAPGDTSTNSYSVAKALNYIVGTDKTQGLEYEMSAEIKQNSAIPGMGASSEHIAIPMDKLDNFMEEMSSGAILNSLGFTTGDGAQPVGAVIRSDVPRTRLQLRNLCTRVAAPNQPKLITLNVADPTGRAAAGDDGFAKSTDTVITDLNFVPHTLVQQQRIDRSATTAANYLAQQAAIAVTKVREVQNRHIAGTGGANDPVGAYATANIGTTTLSANATAAQILTAIAASVEVPNNSKVFVFSHTEYANVKTLSQIANIKALMTDDMIDGARVQSTATFGGSNTHRAIMGPWSYCYLKEFDNAVYVSIQTREGTVYLEVELNWDVLFPIPGLFYRFHET